MNYQTGQVVEVTASDVAHGGWCVARPADGPVLFVRHALPGERVLARITEVTSRLVRAEAVEILAASPDRVDAALPARAARRLRRLRLAARHAARPARAQGRGDPPATAADGGPGPRGHGGSPAG